MQDHPFVRRIQHSSVQAKLIPLLFLEIYPQIYLESRKLSKHGTPKTTENKKILYPAHRQNFLQIKNK